MSNDIKHRLSKVQKSVTTWFGSGSSSPSSNDTSFIGKRISTPQLIKRTLHVAYDTETGDFIGVPTQWQSEFDNMHRSTKSRSRVWYDQCNRKFVNLPAHWQERLLRNNLTDWPEFQRNPDLLTSVFTMMDEELKLMDLTSVGLDSTFYSSVPLSTAERENGKAVDVAASAQQHQKSEDQPKQSDEHRPDGNATAVNGSRNGTNARTAAIVWTQQRSFVRDDESDSEEFAEL